MKRNKLLCSKEQFLAFVAKQDATRPPETANHGDYEQKQINNKLLTETSI